jgi:hypothetical protein
MLELGKPGWFGVISKLVIISTTGLQIQMSGCCPFRFFHPERSIKAGLINLSGRKNLKG